MIENNSLDTPGQPVMFFFCLLCSYCIGILQSHLVGYWLMEKKKKQDRSLPKLLE